MKKRKLQLSKISLNHYVKLVFRSLLLAALLGAYLFERITGSYRELKLGEPWEPFTRFSPVTIVWAIVWVIFMAEMLLRFFPSKVESMGCQKQFPQNYIPTGETHPGRHFKKGTVVCLASWVALNGVIVALHLLFPSVIDQGVLLLISLAYSVCDMICILFFCPFQTWFMKNKCCGSCRIYNWDFIMMFTPCFFIPHALTWSLSLVSLALLIVWEVYVHRHPERFSEVTNAALSCANCQEKLCHHKSQLRHFIRANRDTLRLKGNTTLDKGNAGGCATHEKSGRGDLEAMKK